jgi:hypothetical protein
VAAQAQNWIAMFIWCQTYVGDSRGHHKLWNVSWKANLSSPPNPKVWCWQFMHQEHATAFLVTWGGVQESA